VEVKALVDYVGKHYFQVKESDLAKFEEEDFDDE
jgi:hypothetical protein